MLNKLILREYRLFTDIDAIHKLFPFILTVMLI